jgi:hypothetical protein
VKDLDEDRRTGARSSRRTRSARAPPDRPAERDVEKQRVRANYIGPAQLSKLTGLGRPWIAELRGGPGGLSHMVVVDGVEAGNILIRDPWRGGSTYQMTMDAFQGAWTGNAVF